MEVSDEEVGDGWFRDVDFGETNVVRMGIGDENRGSSLIAQELSGAFLMGYYLFGQGFHPFTAPLRGLALEVFGCR